MDFSIELLGKETVAVTTRVRLYSVMHLLNVLVSIGLLSEALVTAWKGAREGLLLGVRSDMVEELRWIGDDLLAVAIASLVEAVEETY